MKIKSWNPLLLLVGIGISLILMQSCDKLKEATTFKIKYDLPDTPVTIDSSFLSKLKVETELFSQSFPAINIDSIVGKNTGLVDRVNFYKMKLSLITPESATINWLTSARITITPEGGVPVEIATSPVIAATDRSVDFVVKDIDMLTTVKKPFILTIYGNLNGIIPILPMELVMQSGIEITISPL